MSRIIILRPQPGADATAERARALGLAAEVLPLFIVAPLAWTPPDPARFDALMITSANAARHAGADLKRYAALPLFVVGAASAHACREQGLEPVMVGESNAAALVARIAQAGHARVLHLCGADVTEAASGALDIVRVPVYRSVEGEGCDLSGHLHPGDILLVHSPRAGARLAMLVDPEARPAFSLVAISSQALASAGSAWASAQAAPQPTDAAMLALARELCHKPRDHA